MKALNKGSGSGVNNTHSKSGSVPDNGYKAGDTPDSRLNPPQKTTDTSTNSESRIQTDDGRAHMVRQPTVQHDPHDCTDFTSSSIVRYQNSNESTETDTSAQPAEIIPVATGKPHISLCQVQQYTTGTNVH